MKQITDFLSLFYSTKNQSPEEHRMDVAWFTCPFLSEGGQDTLTYISIKTIHVRGKLIQP